MQKFENVDLLDCLEKIVNLNTQYYQTDFEYDIQAIRAAANSDVAEDKHLLWVSRSHGTHCFFEKDVFIKNTPSNTSFKYWCNEKSDTPIAYAISIKEQIDGKVIGNLYQLDYQGIVDFIKQNNVKADNQILHYENGDRIMDFGKWFSPDEHKEYGKYVGLDYIPNEPERLTDILKEVRQEYEHYPVGSIEKHLSDLMKSAVSNRILKMTNEEKESHIELIELQRDYNNTKGMTDFDIALYNALTAERSKAVEKKPSIRQQLSENKAKSEPTKSKTSQQQKEDISL